MRLPESKIKEAIVHPDRLARHEALLYFAGCYSRDVEVMPLAIKAIETYGHTRAFLQLYHLAQLVQSEETIEWAIRELHREENKAEDRESYRHTLSQLLCSADPQMLISRAEAIRQAPGFFKELVPGFQDWLQLAAWDADQCWNELERICTRAIRKQDAEEADFEHANRVARTLARHGERSVERILEHLNKDIVNFETDPMAWLEILLVELAGEMRLESAIGLVVKKLHEEGDVLSEECVEALGKIGTDAAASAVAEGWLEASWEYRLYATGALEGIHSDTTVRKCLELLPQEHDLSIKTGLADALLGQFADEGIEPVREMVNQQAYDSMHSDLMRKLLAVGTVMGVTFPEYSDWKRAAEDRLAEQERKMKEMDVFFRDRTTPALPVVPAPMRDRGDLLDRKPAPFLHTEKHVGRNDPCPCGSGKKYKKCCLNKGN